MLYIPLTTHPVGWVILGISGYFLYQNGKKKGAEEAAATRKAAAPLPAAPQEETQTIEGGK